MTKPVTLNGNPITVFEYLSLGVVRDLFKKSAGFTSSFDSAYAPAIRARLTQQAEVRTLGSSLRDIFFSGASGGPRDNAEVSSAGNSWERLVGWYLSACLYGNSALVLHRSSLADVCPEQVRQALRVNVGGLALEDDNDLIVVARRQPAPAPHLELHVEPWESAGVPTRRGLREAKETLAPSEVEIIGIACKTNFNDSVNSALFWENVYSRWQDFAWSGQNTAALPFTVGTTTGKLTNFRSRYLLALATVPTQKDLAKYKATSAPIVKARLMSGGAFWGAPGTAFQPSLDHFMTRHNLEPPGTKLGAAWANRNLSPDPWRL